MSDSEIRPEPQGMSVVAVGSFNPAIFQPLWFSENKLIRKEEAESAEIRIIHKDVSVFSAEWFTLQVLGDRYLVESEDPTMYQPLRDLALGTFKILEHTPIRAFGFNKHFDVGVSSEEAWQEFGDFYAPGEPWKAVLDTPGLKGLTIQGKRQGSNASYIQVRIEPSGKIRPGIFIHVNEHYDIPKDASVRIANNTFLSTLSSAWDDFICYADSVVRHSLAAMGG